MDSSVAVTATRCFQFNALLFGSVDIRVKRQFCSEENEGHDNMLPYLPLKHFNIHRSESPCYQLSVRPVVMDAQARFFRSSVLSPRMHGPYLRLIRGARLFICFIDALWWDETVTAFQQCHYHQILSEFDESAPSSSRDFQPCFVFIECFQASFERMDPTKVALLCRSSRINAMLLKRLLEFPTPESFLYLQWTMGDRSAATHLWHHILHYLDSRKRI